MIAPKTITVRLNEYDQAVFKCCKDYLEDKEEENFYYGLVAENVTNSTVIKKALSLLWEEARQYRIKQNQQKN